MNDDDTQDTVVNNNKHPDCTSKIGASDGDVAKGISITNNYDLEVNLAIRPPFLMILAALLACWLIYLLPS